MKKLRVIAITLASIGVLFAGCSKDKDNTTQYAQVKVRLSGFTITQEEFPTKSTVLTLNCGLVHP